MFLLLFKYTITVNEQDCFICHRFYSFQNYCLGPYLSLPDLCFVLQIKEGCGSRQLKERLAPSRG